MVPTTTTENFQYVIPSNLVGIFTLDRDGNITEANEAFLTMVTSSRTEFPLRWDALTSPARRVQDQAHLMEVLMTGEGRSWETECLSQDGRRVPVFVTMVPMTETCGDALCTLLDLTAYKQTEQHLVHQQTQLRRLTSELVLAEERERRRIAQLLHDAPMQRLAVAKSSLMAIRTVATADGLRQPLDAICTLLDQTIQEMRTFTYALSSPLLYELGLEAALERLGEELGAQHGFDFHYARAPQPLLLHDQARVMLYYIARELLRNIVKHAQARHVWLTIQPVGMHLHLTLCDDGAGFKACKGGNGSDDTGGFGLFNIRQQLELVEGHLEITTSPEGGSRVCVVAPLARLTEVRLHQTHRSLRYAEEGQHAHPCSAGR